MSRGLGFSILLAAALALVLRCAHLDARPMHTDEAVNAIKFQQLLEHGTFKYDPNEHHGPTLFYFTLVFSKLTGAPDFAHFDEQRLRIVTALFGVGLILLLPLVADGLGRRATMFAAVLTAISPAMVYYSRDFIHEMPLVFFTFLAIACAWRYACSRKLVWILLAGAAVALMQATKETFLFSIIAAAGALILNRPRLPLNRYLMPVMAALVILFIVSVIFFTSFFTNASGPLDAIRTYWPWFSRANGNSPHIHEWGFYLHRLLFFHADGGAIWSEGLIFVLAIAGTAASFTRIGLSDSNPAFVRFLAFYTWILTAIYCAIPYKTPWCLAGFWHGMILMAGVGAVAIISCALSRWMKIFAWLILTFGSIHLAFEAWAASVTFPSDPRNPYVYAQTLPNLLELAGKVEALAKISPDGHRTIVKVMAPENDYWPLPWYLRDFTQAGWWKEIQPDPYAPIMIVSAKFQAGLDAKKTHTMTGIYEMRPGMFFELYVRNDLWRAYLNANRQPNL